MSPSRFIPALQRLAVLFSGKPASAAFGEAVGAEKTSHLPSGPRSAPPKAASRLSKIEPLESRIAPAALLSTIQLADSSQSGQGSVIAVDGQGDLFVAGTFFKSFSPGQGHAALTTTDPAGDLYIVKYDPTGHVVWATTWGGTGAEYAKGIAVDGNGDVFVTGGFLSTNAGFAGTTGSLTAVGNEDVFVIKLSGANGSAVTNFNGTGALQWGGNDSGTGHTEEGLSLTFDGNDLVVAGKFNSANAGFTGGGTTVATQGGEDGFIFRIDESTGAANTGFGTGGMVTLGTSGDDQLSNVVVDDNGDIYTAYQSPGASGPQFAVAKFNGTDGSAASTFGNNGLFTFPSAVRGGPPTTSATFGFAYAGDGVFFGVQGTGTTMQVIRFFDNGGFDDSFGAFGSHGITTVNYDPNGPIQVNVDPQGAIYISGNLHGNFILTRLNASGFVDPTTLGSSTAIDSVVMDSHGDLILRGTYSGSANVDPTMTSLHLPTRSVGAGMTDGYIEKVDPYGIVDGNPLTFVDPGDNTEKITLTGPGIAHATLNNAGNVDELDALTLANTTSATNLTIQCVGKTVENGFIDDIVTLGADQDMGNIILGPNLVLGGGESPGTGQIPNAPNLHVSGKLSSLTVDGINNDAIIELGDGVPAAQVSSNHPNLTIGGVLGDGVQIDVLPNATQPGVGGGGLGNVLIQNWSSNGLIQTTQSVGNFTVEQNDVSDLGLSGNQPFLGVLMIGEPTPPNLSPFIITHTHTLDTTSNAANIGNMTIENGSWGSSGSIIQGNIESFNAQAFLAGASITAGSIGTIDMTTGQFAGTLTLNDSTAGSSGTFTVNSDFTGVVTSKQPLKKLKIKGNFTGSLVAPEIAAITAYSFIGEAPANPGDPPPDMIMVTEGFLGLVKSTQGIIQNYVLDTPADFGGISVNVGKLTQDTVGIENVQITAASIGNISVHLSASKTAGGIDLTGIDNSTFTTTDSGTAKGSIGSIGNITVSISGKAGIVDAKAITNSSFDARAVDATVNPLGKITVKLSGASGDSVGLQNVDFAANSIGATKISVTPGSGGTASAIDQATYTSDGTIGAIAVSGGYTETAVSNLEVWAGGAVAGISISSKQASNGSIANSSILVGQNLAFGLGTDEKTALASLQQAALGAVTLSGSLSNTAIAAGSNIGAVNIGGTVDTSYLLAGSLLGADHQLGGGDDSFQRAASIAAVIVKGAFASTTIAAGVDPGAGGFGDGDDALGAVAGPLTQSSSIGVISLGGGALVANPASPHQYAIEAAAIKKLTLPQVAPVTDFSAPVLIDTNANGEDSADILVRTLQ